MRFVIDGKLYDTETAKVVHSTTQYIPHQPARKGFGFLDSTSEVVGGDRTQTLYETENGNFFYVYYYPDQEPVAKTFSSTGDLYRSMTEGYGKDKRDDVDDIDCAIKWLERHNGAEVIINRWPGRLEIA